MVRATSGEELPAIPSALIPTDANVVGAAARGALQGRGGCQAVGIPPKESEHAVGAATLGSAHKTNTMWVGNLPTHPGEDDVTAAFAPHGALDCVVMRAGSRSYAFV
ncbi:flowering time control protein FPA [Hordeum vulgare]|nr:flowering time control protein FPA [Hordeum vulgare]